MEKPKRARKRKQDTAKAVLEPPPNVVGRTTQGGKPKTPQKSENRIVPEGRRKSTPSQGIKRLGGGKAVPVRGEELQLMLPFATAEIPRIHRGAESVKAPDQSGRATREAWVDNPRASSRVSRGGTYLFGAAQLRTAARASFDAETLHPDLGFPSVPM